MQGTAEEELLQVRHEQQQSDGMQQVSGAARPDGVPLELGPGRRRLSHREGHEAQKRAARNRVLSTLHRVHVAHPENP